MINSQPVYSIQELCKALKNKNSVIAFWGAFRLLRDYPDDLRDSIGYFLDSPHQDVQEAGISQVAKIHAKEYIPQVFQIFRSASRRIKQVSAYPLALFPNDLIRSQLNSWFNDLINSDDYSRADLYYCTLAYLKMEENNDEKILEIMTQRQNDPLKVMALFQNMLLPIEEEQKFLRLIDHYFFLRNAYPTTETIDSLIEITEQSDLVSWVGYKIVSRFSIKDIYEKSLMLLETSVNYSERMNWEKIDKYCMELNLSGDNVPKARGRLLEAMKDWAEIHLQAPNSNLLQKKLLWTLIGFHKNSHSFEESTSKLLESEINLIVSIPLIYHIESALSNWFKSPMAFTSQIANYYHSSILSAHKREQILEFFFPAPPVWEESELRISSPRIYQPEMNQHEILWALYNGDLIGQNIIWPTYFPNPEISLYLVHSLNQIYVANFDFYVQQRDHLSIDYALKLFQIFLNKDSFELMHKNFDFLFQNHQEVLYRTICYAPDERFIDLFLKKYRKGETETGEIIKFLCEFCDKEMVASIEEDLANQKDSQGVVPIRLYCEKCRNHFKYLIEKIFVDENRINEDDILDNRSIWIEEEIKCKSCESVIPFELEHSQLEKLTNEIKLMITFRLSNNPNNSFTLNQFRLFPFPSFQGKRYTPSEFEEFVTSSVGKDSQSSNEYKVSLSLKLARMMERIENWEKVAKCLESQITNTKFEIEVLTRIGFAHYKLGNFLEARKFFTQVKERYTDNLANEYEKIYFDQTLNYIELLDSKADSRKRFTVIQGGK